MESGRFYNTLAEAQVGDFAFVGNSRVVITRITPTGRVVVRGDKNPLWTLTFNSMGNEITDDRWHRKWLSPYTESNYNTAREHNIRKNTLNFLQNVDFEKMSTTVLVDIYELIKLKLPKEETVV